MNLILYDIWVCYDDADNCKRICSTLNRAAAELLKKELEKSTRYSEVWINEAYEEIE